MRVAIAHVGGKYSYPGVAGEQFTEGCDAIWASGCRTLKIYCTSGYQTFDYPNQTWTGSPTTLTTLAQCPEFATQLNRGWTTVIITAFTFANNPSSITNGWRVNPSSAYMTAEYTEFRAFAEHLLSTYSATGTEFRLQNWEGDWAYMDAFVVETAVDRTMLDRYAAFLGTRQRAVSDARKAVASNCKILNVVECNRVLDARVKPHLRRILRDLSRRIEPDVLSWSAYDGTIVDQGGFGASLAAWQAATIPIMKKCIRAMRNAFPNALIQIGEFGFPEGIEMPVGRDIGAMVQTVYDVALAEGVDIFTYWQFFDNEETSPGVPRGFWVMKPDGSYSLAGTKLLTLMP